MNTKRHAQLMLQIYANKVSSLFIVKNIGIVHRTFHDNVSLVSISFFVLYDGNGVILFPLLLQNNTPGCNLPSYKCTCKRIIKSRCDSECGLQCSIECKDKVNTISDTKEGHVKHYITHHVVITPSKASTKVQKVYDSSANPPTVTKA